MVNSFIPKVDTADEQRLHAVLSKHRLPGGDYALRSEQLGRFMCGDLVMDSRSDLSN